MRTTTTFITLFGLLLFVGCSMDEDFFSIEPKTLSISVRSGQTTTLSVKVHIPNFSDSKEASFTLGCQNTKDSPLPSMAHCPLNQIYTVYQADSSVDFPLSIDPLMPPKTFSLQLVGTYLEESQRIEIQTTVEEIRADKINETPLGKEIYARALWTRQIGTSGTDQISTIITDDRGSVYAGVQTTNTFSNYPNLGNFDAFVIKYQPDGAVDGVFQLATSGTDIITSSAIDSQGRLIIAGYTYGTFENKTNFGKSDGFVAIYSTHGNLVWLHQLGTTEIDKITSITADVEGSIYITGTTEGSFPGFNNKGSTDIFVAKFTPQGDLVWVKQLGSQAQDDPKSIVALPNGSIMLAGTTQGALLQKEVMGFSDAWFAIYTKEGEIKSMEQFGTVGSDEIVSLVVDPSGFVYALGNTRGELDRQFTHGKQDGFVMQLSLDGKRMGLKQIGTSQNDTITSGGLYQGSLYVAGYTTGSFDENTNTSRKEHGFVMSLNKEGMVGGVIEVSNGGQVLLNSLTSNNNLLFIAGSTFGAFPKNSNQGDSDGFLQAIELFEE